MNSKKNTQVIVTLGPSSLEPQILQKIDHAQVNYVRINLSHTPINEIKPTVDKVLSLVRTPLILDTEGSQIRTGYLGQESVALISGSQIRLHESEVPCDSENLFLRPAGVLAKLKEGDLIFVDFDTVILRVDEIDSLVSGGFLLCSVITGGVIGNNKAVTIDNQTFTLPPFSEKDLEAIKIGREAGVKVFTLSFMDSAEDVLEFRRLYPEATAISKIESKRGVENLRKIVNVSDGILIDRGDLSREIPLEKIPVAQKIIIRRANFMRKPVFVATNFLDTMMKSLKPSRAETNDIVNTLLDGADGLVLAAETAIGKFPIETIHFLKRLCLQVDPLPMRNISVGEGSDRVLEELEEARFLTAPFVGSSLIPPHGGVLVNRLQSREVQSDAVSNLMELEVSPEVAMDAEQIALGSYSPLTGFMGEADFNSVLKYLRLSNNIIWPLPVVIQITKDEADRIRSEKKIVLRERGTTTTLAILTVEDLFGFNKEEAALRLYGTTNPSHPGVRALFAGGDYIVGGPIELLARRRAPYKSFELTPYQTRHIFESRGWRRVVGFHTRNVIHRSHEYIQLKSLEQEHCDGLFVHPVVGKKKAGDFTTEAIIGSYQTMLKQFYPSEKVLFSTFATFSRYGGPREALFTAICRQNFGCSHFIVGRDHTGVGDFYKPLESQEIFKMFPDLQIQPVFLKEVVYDVSRGGHYEYNDEATFSQVQAISGTRLRELIEKGESPPDWLMRREISAQLLDKKKRGDKIFVD